jgi:transporter family protein
VSATISILLGISGMLGFGVADFIAKAILSRTNALRTALISQSIGTLLYLGVAIVYDLAVPDNTLLFLTLISGTLSAVVLSSYYLALSLGKASLVSPIASCLSVVAVVLSLLVLGETLTGPQLSVIAAVFCGIILVAFDRSSNESSRKVSILFALLAALLGGGNVIIQKWIAEGGHYLMGFFLTRVFMLCFMLPFMPLLGRNKQSTEKPVSYAKMGLLGLIDVSGFFAWYIGLREGLVSVVTPIVTACPAITVILVHLFLNERVRLHQRVGIATIIAGIVILSAIS